MRTVRSAWAGRRVAPAPGQRRSLCEHERERARAPGVSRRMRSPRGLPHRTIAGRRSRRPMAARWPGHGGRQGPRAPPCPGRSRLLLHRRARVRCPMPDAWDRSAERSRASVTGPSNSAASAAKASSRSASLARHDEHLVAARCGAFDGERPERALADAGFAFDDQRPGRLGIEHALDRRTLLIAPDDVGCPGGAASGSPRVACLGLVFRGSTDASGSAARVR